MRITDHQAKYYAHELTIHHAGNDVDRLSQSLFDASVDLNPHQISAALFALNNPLSLGVVLADEVGLGKTIEAGLVLSQYWAERKRKLLIICPASLRRQWAQELQDKFNLPSQILDARTWKVLQKQGIHNPLVNQHVVIMSYHYATRLEEALLSEAWDLVVIDEAHKLRNAHRASNKMGQALRRALPGRKKLLLTATPLQNSLMELYGLSTVIDEHIFGDDRSFRQQYVQSQGSIPGLKARLKSFVQRTLRKDVLEYVRYTQRKTLTVPFTPTTKEQQLYNGITAMLESDQSYALPTKQRHLTGLILRKLLASSSYAVSNTLQIIRRRLLVLQAGRPVEDDLIAQLVEHDDLEQDYLEETSDTDGAQLTGHIDQVQLALEIKELGTYIELANTVGTDSKTSALLTALAQGFEQMDTMGAPQKVIVFTESKRTQEYLAEYLGANGYEGKLVTFNGSNNSAAATDIYQQWLAASDGSDKVSGSPQIDRRSALIDHFRDHAEIMIATEAAAEGVNLQFCSLVINYDLPWNPQRVEQRIGRCHRYGQKFDVVVINFLNNSNLADQRVLELLTEKFHLFDGVFGASDDILGTIESGLDFEKRIQAIYQSCRSTDEIEAAFQQLQKELEADINEKMQQTRQLLLENFDEDIHDLLKIQLDAAELRLDKISRWFWSLTRHQLQAHAVFDDVQHRFKLKQTVAGSPAGHYQLKQRGSNKPLAGSEPEKSHTYRLSHSLGEWVVDQAKAKSLPRAKLEFNYSDHDAKISVIGALKGQSGCLVLQQFSIEALERGEDHLLFAAINSEGTTIPAEVAQKLMQLPAKLVRPLEAGDFEPTQMTALQGLLENDRNAVEKSINDRNLSFFEQEVSKLDNWADDLKDGLEQTIKELDKEIKQVRRDAKIAPTLEEKLAMQKQQKKLESQRNKSRRELFDKQDEVDERREALIETLEQKLNKSTRVENLFTIQWSVK
jgi:superfamily II DNA/RNA helicase